MQAYQGLVRPPAGQDSPSTSPLPGGAPKVNIPADADAASSANFFLQQYRLLADELAFLKAYAKCFPPIAPASGLTGWSNITHVGTGTGTVTPTAIGVTATGTYSGLPYVVKIIVGGAVGTATFQLSLDGGTSYGATTTTAATVAVGGITVAFAGTFVALDTYAFWPAMTPMSLVLDSLSNGREYDDHLGYRFGRTVDFYEDWCGVLSGSGVAGQLANFPKWQGFYNTGTLLSHAPAAADAIAVDWPSVLFTPPTTNGNQLVLTTAGAGGALSGRILLPDANILAVLEFEFAMTAIGANNVTWFLGFDFDQGINGVPASSNVFTWFKKASADTDWIAQVKDGTTLQGADTGIAPVANIPARFRIELHGGNAGPNGVCAKFFINEVHVYSQNVNTPMQKAALNAGGLMFGCQSSAASPTVTGQLSPVRCKWARVVNQLGL